MLTVSVEQPAENSRPVVSTGGVVVAVQIILIVVTVLVLGAVFRVLWHAMGSTSGGDPSSAIPRRNWVFGAAYLVIFLGLLIWTAIAEWYTAGRMLGLANLIFIGWAYKHYGTDARSSKPTSS